MITKLRYIGWIVENLEKAADDINKLFGMKLVKSEDASDGKSGRIFFPNDCWLYVREHDKNDDYSSSFYENHGENLDQLGFESDDINAELDRLKKAGLKVSKDDIKDTKEGLTITIGAEDATGFALKIIQPHADSFKFASDLCSNPEVLGLQHIGVSVKDLKFTINRFDELLGLKAADLRADQHYGTQKDMMIDTGNDRMWLHLVETDDPENRVCQFKDIHGEALEHLAVEVDDIRVAVNRVKTTGVFLFEHKIYLDREDGFEAFVYPPDNHGVTVELIEPYEDSRGYRPRPRS